MQKQACQSKRQLIDSNCQSPYTHITGKKLIDRDILYLVQRFFPKFIVLNLQNNKITRLGAKYLTNTPSNLLKVLIVSNNCLQDDGVQQIAEGRWENLEKIGLAHNNITTKGCLALKEMRWANLKDLNLSIVTLMPDQNNIGAKGVKFLTAANMKELISLHLEINNIGNQGIRHVVKMNLKQLQWLCISHNYITSEATFLIDKLKASPKLKIVSQSLRLHRSDKRFNSFSIEQAKHFTIRDIAFSQSVLAIITDLYSHRIDFEQRQQINGWFLSKMTP